MATPSFVQAVHDAEAGDLALELAQTAVNESSMLNMLPFVPTDNSDLKYETSQVVEQNNADIRPLNGSYTIKQTNSTDLTFVTTEMGGDARLDVRIASVPRYRRKYATDIMGIAQKSAWRFNNLFINGNNTGSADSSFDGLVRIVNDAQLFNPVATPTANGNPLSLLQLNRAITRTRRANAIFCSRDVIERFEEARSNPDVAGYVIYQPAEMGRVFATYRGLPLIPLEDVQNSDVLGFNEPSPGGGTATSTSIYIARVGEDGLHGILQQGMTVTDFGQVPGEQYLQTTVSWSGGIALEESYALSRVRGIADATFTR